MRLNMRVQWSYLHAGCACLLSSGGSPSDIKHGMVYSLYRGAKVWSRDVLACSYSSDLRTQDLTHLNKTTNAAVRFSSRFPAPSGSFQEALRQDKRMDWKPKEDAGMKWWRNCWWVGGRQNQLVKSCVCNLYFSVVGLQASDQVINYLHRQTVRENFEGIFWANNSLLYSTSFFWYLAPEYLKKSYMVSDWLTANFKRSCNSYFSESF